MRMPNRKLRNIPLEGPFHRKLATGSDIIFPCIFLSGSTKCWLGVYLPPPRGTLTGMFNARVWSLANVTAKASCSRSPCVRVNGMFNALVWSLANVTAKASCSRSHWVRVNGCSMLWSGLLILIYVTCRMKCESLQSTGCFFLYHAF